MGLTGGAHTPPQRWELEQSPLYLESKDSLGSAYSDAETRLGYYGMSITVGRVLGAGCLSKTEPYPL